MGNRLIMHLKLCVIFFLKHGVKIKSPGVYQGVKKDFGTFVTAQGQLPQTNWFLKIIDQWYIVILVIHQIVQNIEKTL